MPRTSHLVKLSLPNIFSCVCLGYDFELYELGFFVVFLKCIFIISSEVSVPRRSLGQIQAQIN